MTPRGLVVGFALTLGVLLGGCGGAKVAAVTPTSGPTGTAQSAVEADAQTVLARGYQPVQVHAETPDGFGNTLYAFWGICKDSGDGKCQMVFFFRGSRLLGSDTSAPSTQINNVQPAGTGTIAVTYAKYLSQDPLCCPRGKPVTVTYHWTGSHMVASGTPPVH